MTIAMTARHNALARAADNTLVSPKVKALLPDVLIEYIWGLALSEDWQGQGNQLFVLQAGELGGRWVQNVYHACDFGSSEDMRRVYGVEPINCTLLVLHSKDRYRMKLCAH